MLVRFKVKPTNRIQPPENLDADLRAVAASLKRTHWMLHLGQIAHEVGAITDADLTVVIIAAKLGELDRLDTEAGRRAWAVLAKWLPDEIQN